MSGCLFILVSQLILTFNSYDLGGVGSDET